MSGHGARSGNGDGSGNGSGASSRRAPLLSNEHASALFERVLFEAVTECIDFQRLADLEHMIELALIETGCPQNALDEIAHALVGTALDQVSGDPRRLFALEADLATDAAGPAGRGDDDDCAICASLSSRTTSRGASRTSS